MDGLNSSSWVENRALDALGLHRVPKKQVHVSAQFCVHQVSFVHHPSLIIQVKKRSVGLDAEFIESVLIVSSKVMRLSVVHLRVTCMRVHRRFKRPLGPDDMVVTTRWKLTEAKVNQLTEAKVNSSMRRLSNVQRAAPALVKSLLKGWRCNDSRPPFVTLHSLNVQGAAGGAALQTHPLSVECDAR